MQEASLILQSMSFKWGPEGKCSLAGSDDKGKFELFFELRMDELVLCAIVHEVQDDDNEDELQLKPVCCLYIVYMMSYDRFMLLQYAAGSVAAKRLSQRL